MDNPLLNHPFWQQADPIDTRLVRVYNVSEQYNPFAEDGVVLRVATGFGEAPFHKWAMAREGLLEGVKSGKITPETVVVEATSGNTGLGMATACTMLGLRFVAVVNKDVPGTKLDVIRALGDHISFQSPLPGETTVDAARRLGAQPGWYNPDQYASDWNPRAHEQHLAPQLFKQTPVSLFFTPGGTMGTALGVARYARAHDTCTKVIPVMCAEGEEVPAARTLSRVKKDVRIPWELEIKEEDIRFGTRRESFALSFFSWRFLPVQMGPSSGLAFAGALKFLWEQKAAGTLSQFSESSGKIFVVVFAPDDYRPYVDLYAGEKLYDKVYQGDAIPPLLALIENPSVLGLIK